MIALLELAAVLLEDKKTVCPGLKAIDPVNTSFTVIVAVSPPTVASVEQSTYLV